MRLNIGLKEGEGYSWLKFWKNVGVIVICQPRQMYVDLTFIFFVFTFNLHLNEQWYPPQNRAFWWLRIEFRLIFNLIEVSFNIPLPAWRKLKKPDKTATLSSKSMGEVIKRQMKENIDNAYSKPIDIGSKEAGFN